MTEQEYNFHLTKLRESGRFVWSYLLTKEERRLPRDQQKANMKLHVCKNIDAFVDNAPYIVRQDQEPERY